MKIKITNNSTPDFKIRKGIQINLNLKPSHLTAKTKLELDQLIMRTFSCWWESSGGAGRDVSAFVSGSFGQRDYTKRKVILVNYQKTRRKAKVLKKTIKGKNGLTHARKVIQESHWDAWVYSVPMTAVRIAQQTGRNFKLLLGLDAVL